MTLSPTELQALLDKATPGPWQSRSDYMKAEVCTIIANVDGDMHADGSTTYSYDFICTCEDEFGEYDKRASANARLIALAPQLAAENIALQQEVERLRKKLRKLSFAAQTSGGVAGRDEGLVAAISAAETALSQDNNHN